jgi:molecular chaperone GrpE
MFLLHDAALSSRLAPGSALFRSRLLPPYRPSSASQCAFQSTASSTTERNGPQQRTDADAADDAQQATDIESKLSSDIASLTDRNAELLDKYRRSLAESENMRVRLTKRIDDAKVFGIQSFVKDLLEVADVLHKAVGGVSDEVLENESQYMKDMYQGLQLTETQLQQVFRRHGLEQENPVGEKFDPNRHEALFQIPAPDSEPNTVLEVQKVGYVLSGRTIRPALVGVSKK